MVKAADSLEIKLLNLYGQCVYMILENLFWHKSHIADLKALPIFQKGTPTE